MTMMKATLSLCREADTVGDNPRNNFFTHGLTIARRHAQCSSNTDMTAAGISTGDKVVIDSS